MYGLDILCGIYGYSLKFQLKYLTHTHILLPTPTPHILFPTPIPTPHIIPHILLPTPIPHILLPAPHTHTHTHHTHTHTHPNMSKGLGHIFLYQYITTITTFKGTFLWKTNLQILKFHIPSNAEMTLCATICMTILHNNHIIETLVFTKFLSYEMPLFVMIIFCIVRKRFILK